LAPSLQVLPDLIEAMRDPVAGTDDVMAGWAEIPNMGPSWASPA
jgi:hypothetical protein